MAFSLALRDAACINLKLSRLVARVKKGDVKTLLECCIRMIDTELVQLEEHYRFGLPGCFVIHEEISGECKKKTSLSILKGTRSVD